MLQGDGDCMENAVRAGDGIRRTVGGLFEKYVEIGAASICG